MNVSDHHQPSSFSGEGSSLQRQAPSSHDHFAVMQNEDENHRPEEDYITSPGGYLDGNWASQLLMDPSNDLLNNMDFTNPALGNTGHILHALQYQNHVTGVEEPAAGGHKPVPEPSSDSTPQPTTSKLNNKQRRPCDHCRRRKTKCVIIPDTNNCAQCEAKSLTCTYNDLAPKRRPTESEDGTSSKRYKNDSPSSANLALLLGEIPPPNVPIRNVAPVQDYSSMSDSLLKKTLSLQFPRSSFYVGPTSYLYDVNLLNLIISSRNSTSTPPNGKPETGLSTPNGKVEQIDLSTSISLRKVSETAQFVLKDDQLPLSYQTMSNDVDTIEKFVAPHGQILIDLYFRIIHPSYPILHKKVFLEKYSRTHREFSAPLLAAVYVLAIQWWDYDPQLNRFPKPNVLRILKIGLTNYLLEILKRPKLSAVQAGLLLLQCKNIVRHNNSSGDANQPGLAQNGPENLDSLSLSDFSEWVLCSQVIALSEELGLGLDCRDWKLPKWERGLRKRLAWAVFMEDKWLSLKNARPSHINDLNWVVQSLAEEDFPEKHGDGDLKEGSSDIDNGKKNFMNMVELAKILSDIINEFYSMRAIQEVTDVSQVLKIAKPLQLRLRNWYHSLPIELQMTSVQQRKLCSNGYLQLAYFATELTLHRKIITTMYQQSSSGAPVPRELESVCRTAAKTRLLASIEFVRDLKPEHIHSFWHSSSSANFTLIGTFAAILYMSLSTKEESDFYRDHIFNYRWILKISSKGFDQVGDALLELDMVLNHIPGLLDDGSDMQGIPNVDFPPQQQQAQQGQSRPLLASSSSYVVPSPNKTRPLAAQHSPYSASPHPNFHQPQNNAKNSEIGSRKPSSQNYRFSQGNNLPYASPQAFHTPSFGNQGQNTISRGGQFIVNSPQSSLGLSPKEVKQQRSISVTNGNGRASMSNSIAETDEGFKNENSNLTNSPSRTATTAPKVASSGSSNSASEVA